MRNPIFVRVDRFDVDATKDKIQSIRDKFDSYLDTYPSKSTRSKYSLMGPVGKVLQEARTGKWDVESLAGFAMNIHLSNPNTKGFITSDARGALRAGIGDLLDLLDSTPLTIHDKIIDRIDYGLYFTRRAKGLERLERIRREFISFLIGKYGEAAELAAAWADKPEKYAANLANMPYPSRKMFERATGQKKNDMREFAQQAELRGYELPDDEED